MYADRYRRFFRKNMIKYIKTGDCNPLIMKKIFLAAAYCILIAAPFFAKPKDGSISLAEIDRLIRETDYDAALSALYEFNVSHPERFEDMQRRIRKILKSLTSIPQPLRSFSTLWKMTPKTGKKYWQLSRSLSP